VEKKICLLQTSKPEELTYLGTEEPRKGPVKQKKKESQYRDEAFDKFIKRKKGRKITIQASRKKSDLVS